MLIIAKTPYPSMFQSHRLPYLCLLPGPVTLHCTSTLGTHGKSGYLPHTAWAGDTIFSRPVWKVIAEQIIGLIFPHQTWQAASIAGPPVRYVCTRRLSAECTATCSSPDSHLGCCQVWGFGTVCVSLLWCLAKICIGTQQSSMNAG